MRLPKTPYPATLLLVFALVLSPYALADEFRHEANVMARMGNHPSVDIPFTGFIDVEVSFQTDASGYTNPAYAPGTTYVLNRSIYNPTAAAGTPQSVISISFELDTTGRLAHLHSEGIVHRDIATRNMLINTTGGVYGTSDNITFDVGHDGPTDIRSNVGPVRWMSPEAIREKTYKTSNPTDPNDYIEIELDAFEPFLTVSYVPEPSSLAMLGLTGLLISRRRRG